MRVAFYLRVSTNEQTTENQRAALQAVATARGWEVVRVYEDAGISGAKSRTHRPGLDSMLMDALRGEFDLIATWSVDRLGRSLRDLVETLHELQACNVQLYVHQQSIDTTTSSGRALFAMLGVFAEFEREMIAERVQAGLARARAAGRIGGRPKLHPLIVERVRAQLALGHSVREAARRAGCSASAASLISRTRI